MPPGTADAVRADVIGAVTSSLAGVPDKDVARVADMTPRNVKALRHGEHAPQASHLILLARAFPTIRRALLDLIGGQAETPEDLSRAMQTVAEGMHGMDPQMRAALMTLLMGNSR